MEKITINDKLQFSQNINNNAELKKIQQDTQNSNTTQPVVLKKNVLVSPEMISKIRTDLIEPSYYDDIKYNIHSKSRWQCIGDVTETISHVFIGFGTILAFAAGFFNISYLSFLAGSCTTAAMIFIKFSSYAMKESKERIGQVNLLIEQLGFNDIPDIVVDSNNDDDILSNGTMKK